MGMEDATKKDHVQDVFFFFKKLQRRPGQSMAEWVSVFEKAVLDMKTECLNVELKSMGWHLFEKSSLTLERQERVLGVAGGEYEFATIRGALIKLFPDTIISQEKRSVPDRKPGHVTDRKTNDRFKNRFRKPRGRGVTQPMKLMHMMQNKTELRGGTIVRGRVRLDDSLRT